MIRKTSTALSSVLPLDARIARIAAEGGLTASLQSASSKHNEVQNEFYATEHEPDELDSIVLHSAENRIATSLSVPRPSVQSTPHLNSNPI